MEAPLEGNQEPEGAVVPDRDGIISMFNFSTRKEMNCRSDDRSSTLASTVHQSQRVFEASLSIQ